ncbi:MAG: TonB-dependent receptor [Bacteroidales bacterium]|nr:TonB-dependent receptor [Bacteroidales bacterium]
MRIQNIFAALVLYTIPHNITAQSSTIKGKVTTADGQPAAYVNVVLVGTTKGTVVDSKGYYEISKVKAGTYVLRASFVGLQSQSREITVKENETLEVNFVMEENSEELKEVVVTANPSRYVTDYPSVSLRLRTPLLEIPQNIQIVTKQVIDDQQIFDMLEGVTRNVSGATRVEHWDIYAQINMRGSRIAAFRNGMNIQSDWGPLTEDMCMVERIEFVKGPSGFMLANAEPSGFYNVVTKKPTGLSKAEATMTVGSFGNYRTSLDFDGKLDKNNKMLYRLNIMGQTKNSHRRYEYLNKMAIAPVVKFQLTPNTSLTFEYTYQYNQMSPIGSNYAFSAHGLGELPVDFGTAEPNMKPTYINDQSIFTNFSHALNDNWKFTGQLAYMHYNQTGSSLWPKGFSNSGDTLFRGMTNWDVLGLTKVGQFFVNGDVQTGIIRHRILAGIDMGDKKYYHDWSQSDSINGSTPFNVYNPTYGTVSGNSYPSFDRRLDIRERGVYYSNSYSAFYLQNELGLLDDRLRITLAGRYTTTNDANPYSGTVKAEKITPRVGVSFSINKNTSIYAVYDESFIPQAGADFYGKSFEPITGNNKELGIKKEWLDGLWTASLALYQITKNNVLAADPEHQYFSVQLGQTQTKGIEFDLRGQILQNLDVTFNYAYTDGSITKDTDPQRIGAQIPGTSKHIGNLWVSYSFDKSILKGWGLALGYQYAADRSNWDGAYDNTTQKMPDYQRMDGSISYQASKFSISLIVNNILDKYLYSGAYYTWGGFYYWQTEPLRNYRLTFSYKF